MAGALTKAAASSGALDDTDNFLADLKSVLPDQDQEFRDRNMAWGAGFGAPGDVGGALSRAMGSELYQRNKQQELRNAYIPAVVEALSAQRRMQQVQQMLQGVGMIGGGAPQVGPDGQPMPGAPAQGGGGGGGLANMSPEQVAMIENATGMKLKDLWEKAKFGNNQAPGSYAVMPNGAARHFPVLPEGSTMAPNGGVQQVPNAAEVQGNMAAAKSYGTASGQAPFEMVPTVSPSGQPGSIRKTDVPGAPGAPTPYPSVPGAARPQNSGQGMPPAQTATPAPVPTRPGQAYTPQQQAEMDKDIPAILTAEYLKHQAVLAQAAPDTPEYDRAATAVAGIGREMRRHGIDPGSVQVPTAAGRAAGDAGGAPASFVPSGVSPAQKQVQENLGTASKQWLEKDFPSVMAAADEGKGLLSSVQTMRIAMNKLGPNATGWGTEGFKKPVAEFLGSLGVKNAAEAATSYQQFEQAVNTRMWEVLNNAKGPQTEGDAARARATLASLGKTPRANQFMVDMMEASAERNIRRADFYRKARIAMQDAGEADLTKIDEAWNRLKPEVTSVWSSPKMKRWAEEGKAK